VGLLKKAVRYDDDEFDIYLMNHTEFGHRNAKVCSRYLAYIPYAHEKAGYQPIGDRFERDETIHVAPPTGTTLERILSLRKSRATSKPS
jgi:hypothetical protein